MPYNPGHTNAQVNVRGSGKPVKVQLLTPYEARQAAMRLLRTGMVQRRTKYRALIDLLSSAGILPSLYLEELLGLTSRSVRRYREKSLIERIGLPAALEPFVPTGTHFLYTLGPVGLHLAEMVHGMTPTGYSEALQDKVTHDVLCNTVYYSLYRQMQPLGYNAILYSKYEATVHDLNGKPVLEPDALIRLEHASKPPQVFLLEYHNEHFGSRVEEKILRYERTLREQESEWRSTWQVEEVPTVLAVWTHRPVGVGYAVTLQRRREQGISGRARWLGKPLQALLDKQTLLLWDNLTTGQPNDRLLR